MAMPLLMDVRHKQDGQGSRGAGNPIGKVYIRGLAEHYQANHDQRWCHGLRRDYGEQRMGKHGKQEQQAHQIATRPVRPPLSTPAADSP